MDGGKKVWVPHAADGFKLGRITDIGSDNISIEPFDAPGTTIHSVYDRVFPAEEYDNKDVDDNCGLMFLNEATLLHNLRIRYMKNMIYTYTANILIALNPYYEVPDLYTNATIQKYQGKSLGTMPPHVYAIADKALRDMKVSKLSQSIIVSGESGAGKTESTKYILKYLTMSRGQSSGQIEQRILESNPLLEAFGNAKTMRNNNSSRFGKFIEIHFSGQMTLAGGFISHYLLEKSRICVQSANERNYHIFYRLCAGAPDDLYQKLKLVSPDQFHYLNRGCTQYFCGRQTDKAMSQGRKSKQYLKDGSLSDPVIDDVQNFKICDDAMKHLGFSDSDRLSVYKLVAGVLHLGNISFEENHEDTKGGCKVMAGGESALDTAAGLLALEREELRESLTSRIMQTAKGGSKGTIIKVPLKVGEASSARDALAKSVYSRLFDFIVASINKSIPFSSSVSFIGLLDIAGFEYFQVNSFEQFCINYCNEKLQQFFNDRILKEEQLLYEKEGLNVKKIEWTDNKDCIELIEMKVSGIFDLLDEESKLPLPKPDHFTMEVHNRNKKHFRLSLPRKSKLKMHRDVRDEEGFLIRHFAGAVCYHTVQFIEKNNDSLHASLQFLIQDSKNDLLKKMFEGVKVSSGKLNFISVGSKFRSQLVVLMEKLKATGTNFIRCIKPNLKMVDHMFEGAQILSQLECSGMNSVLDLMQQGFPSRTQFVELYNMYKRYLPPELARLDPRLFCKVSTQFNDLLRFQPSSLAFTIVMNQMLLVYYRYQMITKVVASQAQVAEMSKIVGQLKKDKDTATKQINAVQTALQTFISKIRKTDISPVEMERTYNNLLTQMDQNTQGIRKLLEKQKIKEEEERLRKIQEEMEREKKRKEEEERKKRAEEEERKLKVEMESKRKREEEEQKKKAEVERLDREKMKVLLAKEAGENKQRQHQLEQEHRDRELALRLAMEDEDAVEDVVVPPLQRSAEVQAARTALLSKKYDLSKWKYAELRDTINTSCDIELLDACRAEFHRRLKVYHAWKSRNKKTNDNTPDERAPKDLVENAEAMAVATGQSTGQKPNINTKQDAVQRFFRIPFARPSDDFRDNPTGKKHGMWWAHFDGQWIARQMEMYPDKQPIILVSGVDDMQMCELSLEETGLGRKKGAEILGKDFEAEWIKNGGKEYLKKHAQRVSSQFLKKRQGLSN
ncbi:Unconventional myosin-VI [Mizuhopecten yessoensis]|uniref:Unconventional myosin-VI n=1 Tax=Mizuhopecten yessoensis TaxID=6573 RepID=A0A210PIL3_MIZYE|nr:Unconventional myosin-VI [Mizuhopecten yessoensis]